MNRHVYALAYACCLLAARMVAGEGEAPIALHADNPHYFQWRGKPTVLVTSAEHYGAVLNVDFDYVRYLDELQAHGLNHTRTFSGTYREVPSSFGISENTLAPKAGKFLSPWARSAAAGRIGWRCQIRPGSMGRSLFQRLKDFMTKAKERGVVVELNIFCPMYTEELWLANPMNARNNVNGIGQCPRQELYSLKHSNLTEAQIAVTKKIVTALRDFDNLYYEVCNEPYQRGILMDWQHRIVDAIVEAEQVFAPPSDFTKHRQWPARRLRGRIQPSRSSTFITARLRMRSRSTMG